MKQLQISAMFAAAVCVVALPHPASANDSPLSCGPFFPLSACGGPVAAGPTLSAGLAASTPILGPYLPEAPAVKPVERDVSRGYSVTDFSSALQLERATSRITRATDPVFSVDSIDTPLGLVHFRAPRAFAAEDVARVKRSVVRAWTLAAHAADELRLPAPTLDPALGWNVSLSPETVAAGRGGSNDTAYCHSAWIGPPADIVVDGYRILHPCDAGDSSRGREDRLVRSLVHEVGHAIEFQLLGKGFSRRERWHSEGFAVWFELAALPLLTGDARAAGAEQEAYRERSRAALAARWRPMFFAGTPEDYARSFGLVSAVVSSGGVEALRSVYGAMDDRHLSFEEAVRETLGWTYAEWAARARSS